jgi:hypothetical protein
MDKEKAIAFVSEHLKERKYTGEALREIRCYLLGAGVIDGVKELKLKKSMIGDGTIEDFHEWFDDEFTTVELLNHEVTLEEKESGNKFTAPLGFLCKVLEDYGFTVVLPNGLDGEDIESEIQGEETDEEEE